MEEILFKFDNVQKRFTAKYLIVSIILKRYASILRDQAIYLDFPATEDTPLEVCHHDLKKKRAYLYKIYLREAETFEVENYRVPFLDTKVIKININELSSDIEEQEKQLMELVI